MTEHQLYIFVAAMLGHFVGDYLFQNQWMAIGKSHPGKRGHIACTVHVLLYTLAIALFTGTRSLPFLLAIAIPHWIIDRWSLATYILKFKNGYGLHQVWKDAPLCARPVGGELQQNVWKVAFAAPVYIMNDNTLHWICLFLTTMYLVKP
jgi:hypothetical protein